MYGKSGEFDSLFCLDQYINPIYNPMYQIDILEVHYEKTKNSKTVSYGILVVISGNTLLFQPGVDF